MSVRTDPPRAWAEAFDGALAMLRALRDSEGDNLSELGIAVVALRGSAREYIEDSTAEAAWTLEHAALYYAEQLAVFRCDAAGAPDAGALLRECLAFCDRLEERAASGRIRVPRTELAQLQERLEAHVWSDEAST